MSEPGRRTQRIAEEKAAKRKKSNGRAVFEWVRDIVIAIIVAIIVLQFISPTFVDGRSMEPNLHDGDYLIVSKQSYGLFRGEPEYGDVVVVHTALLDDKGNDKLIIKRVIGLPGDVITIENGEVYVNGELQDASYTNDGVTNGSIHNLEVPEGYIFCLGDNRLNSKDSRSGDVGCIPEDAIVGKAVLRLLPFSDFGSIYNPYDDR